MGYIAGRVLDSGTPVSGATVRAHRVDDGTLEESDTTDSNGLFVFSALVTGDEYTVVAHDPAGGTAYNAIVWDKVVALASLARTLTIDVGGSYAAVGSATVKNETDYVTVMLRFEVPDGTNEAALTFDLGDGVYGSGTGYNSSGDAGSTSGYFSAWVGASSASAAVALGTGDGSVELWMNPTAGPTPASGDLFDVFWIGDTDVYDMPAGGLGLSYDENYYLTVYHGTYSFVSANPLTQTTWAHVALVKSGTTLKLFIDGVEDSSVTCSESLLGATIKITPREYIDAGTIQHWAFDGELDEFRVIKGWVKYTGTFTPAATHPTL